MGSARGPTPSTSQAMSPRDAFFAPSRPLPLQECAGEVSAEMVTPYPPGIPVLVPGQLITDDIVEYLIRYLRVQNKVELHGVVYQGYFPSIRVVSGDDARRLASLLEATQPSVVRRAA